MRTPAKIASKLKADTVVTLNDILRVNKNDLGFYMVYSVHTDGGNDSLFLQGTQPTEEQLRYYSEAAQTVGSWEENDGSCGDVESWTYDSQKFGYRWTTSEGNFVEITEKPEVSIESDLCGDVVLGSFVGEEESVIDAKLKLAIFMCGVTAEEFDYLCAKYNSMIDNLTDVSGITDHVAKSLLRQGCETYTEAYENVEETAIHSRWKYEAKNELQNRAEAGEELVDPNVTQEFSNVIVAQHI